MLYLLTVPGVAVSVKNEGGTQHQEYSATPVITNNLIEVPIAKIRIAEWVCFYLPGTLKFVPLHSPAEPLLLRDDFLQQNFRVPRSVTYLKNSH